MGDYARLIADLKLVKELKKSAGRDDIPAEEVEKLVALVNQVADIAGPLLERIPATFKQYTEHNILHCKNLIHLMGRFIPRETLKQMNGLEISVLILSALLHDFGMFVSEDDKRQALKSPQFESFLLGHHDRAAALEEALARGDRERAEVIQDALLAEYFRRMHPERAREKVRENLPGRLVYGDVDISPYVLDVCESHAWGVHESNDPKHPEKSVSALSTNRAVYGVPLNLQYIACCLRLADIMDFDRSRTPLVVFQNIDFTEEKSWEEWNKHLSVVGWVINERDVMFRTECKHPSFYVAVMEFLDWVDLELVECRRLVVKDAPRDIAERYKLHLPPVVDRSEVEMEDKTYLAGAFRFQLEYERIMKLLMDKSLYPDPSLFLRELLQNSLDACRNREAHAKEAGQESLYTPRIAVWDYSDDPEDPRIVFQDNGMGMSRKIVENYFMRVGRSYYRSPEFDAERARLSKKGIDLEATSQFGIGILSCFMVADRFEVETYRVGHRPLHITIEGPTKYFTIKLLPEPPRADFQAPPLSDLEDGPPNRPGTRVTVHLRPAAEAKVLQTIETFAVNVDYDIAIYHPGMAEQRLIPRRRWESRQFQLQTLSDVVAEWERDWSPDEEEYTPPTIIYRPEVEKNLRDVLAQSHIPFDKYDFSRHLRGGAWLWLLKGEGGEVCPQRGYLKISSRQLSCTGLPEFLGRAELLYFRVRPDSPGWGSLLQALRDSLEGDAQSLGTLRERIHHYVYQRKARSVLGVNVDVDEAKRKNDARNTASSFTSSWADLTRQSREVACEYFEAHRGEADSWLRVEGVAEELLRGGHGWVTRGVSFVESLKFNAAPQNIALYGVLLPAGFVQWDPMAGSSRKLNLISMVSGAQVDVRGAGSPVPAASRLFVEKAEAAKVGVPFAHAVLRHALELASANENKGEWREWFSDLLYAVLNLHFWLEAVSLEFEMLEQYWGYEVFENGELLTLTRQQVIEKYGRWSQVFNFNTTTGLSPYGTAGILLLFRPRRRGDQGWEVDMESVMRPQEETLQKARDACDAEVEGWD